jgi:hypothetical protein
MQDSMRSDEAGVIFAVSAGCWPRDLDTGGGLLPDEEKAGLVAEHPYNRLLYGTYEDTFGCLPPPGGDLRDAEDYCLRRQASWTNGSAEDDDRAHPGQQWEE